MAHSTSPPQQTQQEQQQAQHGWPHLVAGGIAGSTAVLFLHPFDVVKTRLQVQDGAAGTLPAYRGTRDAVQTILRTEGWRGLYAGLTPSLIGAGVSWGAYLYLYERVKHWHRDWQKSDRLSPGWNLLSAAQAGAMVCLLTNPVWLVKTRLALQQRGAAVAGVRPYKGLIDAFVRIGREEGFRGYYKGLGPSLILQTTHGAVQFAVYEELKHLLARTGQSANAHDRQLTSLEVSGAGALSKLMASITTYPTQVVRSRLQQRFDTGRTIVYRTTWEAVRLTWTREGLLGFYKGLVPSLLRVMPQSAITLVVYENILRVLSPGSSALSPRSQQLDEHDSMGARGSSGSGSGSSSSGMPAEGSEQRREGHAKHSEHGQPQLVDKMQPLVIAADSQAEN